MNLFDQLVNEALQNQPALSPLKIVVEKELLHHDILRILSHAGLLESLTFMGGTCLRCCYGAIRLSEDLDFTGGSNFTRENLVSMADVLIENLYEKYGLVVKVSEPVKDKTNVDTWKIKMETRPGQRHLPAQRINIDICSIPSYELRPMLLLNFYGVDMGTSGLILQAESREEIYIDKLLAFALRPNRIKYRDVWDILWLHQQGVTPRFVLLHDKLKDHHCMPDVFWNLWNSRRQQLTEDPQAFTEFKQEMLRFLPQTQLQIMREQKDLKTAINYLFADLTSKLQQSQNL